VPVSDVLPGSAVEQTGPRGGPRRLSGLRSFGRRHGVGAAAAVLILGREGVAATAAAGVLMTVTGTLGGLCFVTWAGPTGYGLTCVGRD
jgi:hypothetical protein